MQGNITRLQHPKMTNTPRPGDKEGENCVVRVSWSSEATDGQGKNPARNSPAGKELEK